jgi:hypothetical protein
MRSIERLYEFYHLAATETTIGRTYVRVSSPSLDNIWQTCPGRDTIEQVFESGGIHGYGQAHGERERDPRWPS